MKMKKNQAIDYVKEHYSVFLQPATTEGFVCPDCGNGSGPDGTGMTLNSSKYTFYCGKENCSKGDVIQIYRSYRKIGFKQALFEMTKHLGVDIEDFSFSMENANANANAEMVPPPSLPSSLVSMPTSDVPRPEQRAERAEKGIPFDDSWAQAFPGSAGERYLMSRGISSETASNLGVGFVNWHFADNPARTYPAVSFPGSTAGSYELRFIDDSKLPGKNQTHRKCGPSDFFNFSALETEPIEKILLDGGGTEITFTNANGEAEKAMQKFPVPVFVVEAAIDAMSIIEAGGLALSLNSANNTKAFAAAIQELQRKGGYIPPLLLALDADDMGRRANGVLVDSLTKCNAERHVGDTFVNFRVLDTNEFYGGSKDANDALMVDRCRLTEKIRAETRQFTGLIAPANMANYYNNFFLDDCLRKSKARRRLTGIAALDDQIHGLSAGVWIFGAAPGSGKTTLLLQIADHLASVKVPVLFFSAEMDRCTLLSRSLSRIMFETIAADNDKALSANEISENPDIIGNPWFEDSISYYQAYIGDYLSVYESNFDFEINGIISEISKFITANTVDPREPCEPVVVIDYLQSIRPSADDRNLTRREGVDNILKTLTRFARERNIAILAISSLNRGGYGDNSKEQKIDFTAFKETGAIEYDASAVFGMWELSRQRVGDVSTRTVKFECLKTRVCDSFSLELEYIPKHNLFRSPKTEPAIQFTSRKRPSNRYQ